MKMSNSQLYAVVKAGKDELEVVYGALHPTRALAYAAAGRKMGSPPYTTVQLKAMGFHARLVQISVLE